MNGPSPPVPGFPSGIGRIDFRSYPDMAALARALADDVAARLADAVMARGNATLIVPGGASPGPLFDALCDADLPWADITISLSDERWVHVGDAGSNERLVRERLLEGRARKARFVSWRGAEERMDAAAERMDAATEHLNAAFAPLVPLDVCVLGLGLDGHVASLVPGAEGFEAAMHGDATVLPIHAPGAAGAAARLTLTFSAIAASRLVVLLFSGDAKRAVFERAMEGIGAAPIVGLLRDAKSPIWVRWSPEAKP